MTLYIDGFFAVFEPKSQRRAFVLYRILIVEDDAVIAAAVKKHLKNWGMEALCAHLSEQAPILPVCFSSSSVLYQTGVVTGLTPTMAEPFYNLSSCEIHLEEDSPA